MHGTELDGAGVVITGAAGGIGAAYAKAFAARGARLVLADLDADAVRATADELGAHGIGGDAATVDGVATLVRVATDRLGAIDVYCANAGVAPLGGPEAAEELWAVAWEVNVLAHVRAARELLPDWLARGGGRFVATVSAAGLLTTLGSAPYSVTKHGALAFAEWLSATYRHRGVVVHAVCPQGVRTKMLEATGPAGELIMGSSAIEPEQVADSLLAAIDEDRFLALPHPEVAEYYRRRAEDTDRWLAGMNKLQRKVEEL